MMSAEGMRRFPPFIQSPAHLRFAGGLEQESFQKVENLDPDLAAFAVCPLISFRSDVRALCGDGSLH
jgi:hypothetical protein